MKRERERETDRETDRQTERETDRERAAKHAPVNVRTAPAILRYGTFPLLTSV